MLWNKEDHPRDEDGKFTFKNGGITSTSHMSREEIANILFSDTRKQKEEKEQIKKRKKELLDILGDKATSADILIRTPEELEKKIKEEGLGRKKDVLSDGTSKAADANSSTIPLPGNGSKTIPYSNDKKDKEKEVLYQPKMYDKIPIGNNSNSSSEDWQNNQAPFKLHAQYDDTFNNNEINVSNVKSKIQDENFNKIIKYTHEAEGGFVDNKNDRGGRTNMGVTQRTFDAYNKKMNRPLKDVKNITKDEADEIYYKEYYLASGADKIKDKNLRYLHYDSAVNHGVGRAKEFLKQSGGDFDKYMKLRNNFYDNLAKDEKQKEFIKGWKNRTGKIQKMKDENILDD